MIFPSDASTVSTAAELYCPLKAEDVYAELDVVGSPDEDDVLDVAPLVEVAELAEDEVVLAVDEVVLSLAEDELSLDGVVGMFAAPLLAHENINIEAIVSAAKIKIYFLIILPPWFVGLQTFCPQPYIIMQFMYQV